MRGEGHGCGRIRLRLAMLTLVGATAAGAGAATGTTTSALPDACKLLTRTEAQALTGVKMKPAIRARTSCTYNGYPTGPAAQVFIFVSSTVPRTLLVDRQLGHKFWSVPRLGDQALEEQWNIFVRKGTVWVTITLVRIDTWTLYRKRLERAAAIAISRVKRSRKPAAVSSAAAAPDALAHGPPLLGASGSERDGGGITRYAGVVYQPGVVRIGGGENSIRGVSDDGLTWTIDAHAPGAAGLRVGKIMLATALATGRVVALRRTGSSLEVTLGPVGLTDVLRDGTFEWRGALPLTQPLVARAAAAASPASRPSAQSTSAAGGLTATPICCSRGLGVHLGYNRGGGRLSATVQLDWRSPNVLFKFSIDHGHARGGVELPGISALEYEISGATLSSSGNLRSSAMVVRPMTFQLAGPIAVTFTQKVSVSMQLAGRATLKGHGRYLITNEITSSYVSGSGLGFGFAQPGRNPVKMSTSIPLTEHTLALGVGENAFSLGWALRVTAGVGVGAFAANAWYELKTGLALVADGSLDSLKPGCVTEALSVDDKFGDGYTPQASNYRKEIHGKLGARRAKPVPEVPGETYGPYEVWHPPRAEHCAPTRRQARADTSSAVDRTPAPGRISHAS